MAEPFHVPQQSRRDKLRILEPLYNDPSINLEFFPNSYMDPIQENNFLYTPQNIRFLENNNNNHYHQGLSLSLSSRTSTTTNNDMSKKSVSCVPFGPFTGYSLILKRSRFLKPAETLLKELLCDVGILYSESLFDGDDGDDCLMEVPEIVGDGRQVCSSHGDDEHLRKKSRLISMLHEVYQKYKQYNQQLEMVVTSFESVAGLGNAAPFANLALKALSKHFKCLKDSITDQLKFTSKSHGQVISERSDLIPRVSTHNAGFVERIQPVWRPQRGLPERAVTVLRAWLFDHFLHPYPTDTDKVMLARQTGLSRNQVSNWFINARVRLWKPMVEEIHNLETREAHKSSQKNEGQNSNPIEHFPISNNSNACNQTPSTTTSTPKVQDIPSKPTRNDSSNIPIGTVKSINLSYGDMSSGTGGVSLTLGLHHQNSTGNIGLSAEPFSINAARRFGIDTSNGHHFNMVSGFEEPNGHAFGRNVVISGQFLHDFAG